MLWYKLNALIDGYRLSVNIFTAPYLGPYSIQHLILAVCFGLPLFFTLNVSAEKTLIVLDRCVGLPKDTYITFLNLDPSQEDSISSREQELRDLKDSLEDTQPVGSLVKCCKTLDQVCKQGWPPETSGLTHLCLASHKLDLDKRCRPRSDAAERGVWLGSTLFAYRNFYQKQNKKEEVHQTPLKW